MDLIGDLTTMESPMPRAVRLLGVFGFFAVLGAGPVLQLVSGPAESHAAVPPPAWDLSVFREGDWTSGLESYAQESSPLTSASVWGSRTTPTFWQGS